MKKLVALAALLGLPFIVSASFHMLDTWLAIPVGFSCMVLGVGALVWITTPNE